MLKKSTIDTIEKTLGITAGELAKAISDEEEKEVTIPKLHTYTDEEWEKYESELEKERDEERKKKFDEGREVGVKAEVNRLSESTGVTLEGTKKTFENFTEAYKKKVLEEAKIEPQKQVEELKDDLQKVREELEVAQSTLSEKDNEYKTNLKAYKTEQEISKIIPVDRLNEHINADDVPTIIKSNFDFDFSNDNFVIKEKGGDIIKDKTRQPVNPKEYVLDFLKERKYISENGRGAGDSGTGGSVAITKLSEFEEWWDKNGEGSISGAKAQAKLAEITKENKEFDFNS